MIYSKTCEYALRALAYLARKERQAPIMIPEISRAVGVPRPYLAKIFQALVRKGILKSQRGPSGGFSLARAAHQVTLREVAEAIDDFSRMNDCVMGFDRCSEQNACPLHEVWSQAKITIISRMDQQSLMDLNKKMGKVRYRGMRRSYLNSRSGLSVLACEKRAA